MNIWMINHYAESPAQGWSARHVSLAAELVRRGHSVSLFASSFNLSTIRCASVPKGEHVDWEEAMGVKIGWLPTPAYSDNSWGRAWNMLVFAWRIRQLPRHCSDRPDIIYGSTPSLFAALAGLVVARRFGIPFVLEVRDVWPQTLIDLGLSRFHPFVVLSAVIERYLYRYADAIVTLMPNATSHLVTRGAAPERIHWIPNGVNFDFVPPVSPPEQKDGLDVMYAGAYGSGNNPETILDAAAKLKQRSGPAMRFRFIGNGSNEAAMIAKRAALGLDNVSFEPPVPRSQVYSLLRQADITVAPAMDLNVHRFGVSLNKLFDYMAVARPIVLAVRASNHPVLDAGCGLECPPNDPDALADAISTLAAMSPEERWEMGLRGRHYVEENHDFARLAVRLEAILGSASRKSPAAVDPENTSIANATAGDVRRRHSQPRELQPSERAAAVIVDQQRVDGDLKDRNLEVISSLRLHNMTVEEMIEADSRAGSHLHFSDGVWWREVKPFFYLPASFMTPVVPHQAKPKPWLALGGYYHMVPPGAPSNGVIVTNEILDLPGYGLQSLQPKKRQQIRKILSLFRIARIENLNDLLTDGYRVYVDWEKRKNPRFKRSNPAVFKRWITRTFHHPYKLILGAYAGEQLVAFLVAEAVEGVSNASELFSDSSFDRQMPSIALRYAYAKISAQSPEIRKTCDGFRSLIDSLEHHKSLLGFQHMSYPALVSLRTIVRPLVRLLMPTEYRRLMGQYQRESPTYTSPVVASGQRSTA